MNNSKRYIAIVLSITFVVSCLAGCSGLKKKDVFNQIPTEKVSDVTAPSETLEAVEVEKEIVSFTDKDKDENEITCSPIYDSDGETVVAGYILSVKDKAGKALTAKEFSLLNSIVKAENSENSAKLCFDKDGKLIPINSYANEKGDIIAIQDTLDLDGDKNVEEYLRVSKKKDANGLSKVIVEYVNVEVKNEKGKTVVVDGDKKTDATKVDSNNKKVADKEKQDTEKNEAAKQDAEKTTTKPGKKPDSTSTTKPGDSSTTATTTEPVDEEIKIVLKRNSKATSSSSSVGIEDAQVTIQDEGDYVITSETDFWHGRIVIKLPNDSGCSVKFKDVNITYNKGNVIQIIDTSITNDRTFLETETASSDDFVDNELQNVSESDHAPNVSISFPEGTSSRFESTANSYTGVMYNESKLNIKGNGSVTFESKQNSDNCICSTKSITIKNCSVNLFTAQNQNPSKLAAGNGAAKGIFSYNKVTVESGSLNVAVNGDGIRCSRFICEGGVVDVKSSACDAFDTDNEITVNGGKVTASATEKSAFKVRRVNAGKQRAGKHDTFEINGGTVIGQGKKSTPVQSSSSQASLNASIRSTSPEKTYGTRGKITIKAGGNNVATSEDPCTTFVYSTSSVSSSKSYSMTANSHSADFTFNGKVGTASFAG